MRILAAARHPRLWSYERARRQMAKRFLNGSGIEIGALHHPFPLPEGATVRYVDRLRASELREEYPELGDQPLVEVDVIDDGETLSSFADKSLDFVIASHFLEHCEDPIGAMKAHLRVVRSGGIVLLALPDRRHGIDRARPPTTLEHLLLDHDAGPRSSRTDHYREWTRLVEHPVGSLPIDDLDEHASALEKRRYSIHFHCWTEDEFVSQLQDVIRRTQLPVEIVERSENYHEFLVILRRTDRMGGT